MNEDAVRLHASGLNCAQCVLSAAGRYTGLEDETAKRIAAGFGGGVRSGEICGAISGAVMALGMIEEDRTKVSAVARQCVEDYRQQYGCVRCLELKRAGIPCDELIARGAAFVENYEINEEKE